jgi:hypothetical protein
MRDENKAIAGKIFFAIAGKREERKIQKNIEQMNKEQGMKK